MIGSKAASRASRIGTAVMLLAFVAALSLMGCSGGSDATVADTTSTIALGSRDVVTVVAQPISSGITVTGSLDPAQSVEVKAQLAGQLGTIRAERGTPVRRGAVLVTIDAAGVRAQSGSAQASLASAERDLRAADTLYKAGAISERDFAQALLARDVARAQLTQARETLGHATVTAPISGVVSEKTVESGEAVKSDAKLFTIANIDSLELVGRVTPEAVGGVHVGQPVELTLDAYPGRTITGRVARVEPVADPETRQVAVHVHVPNRDHALVAGLFASGKILNSESAKPVPVLPVTAVRTTGTVSVVYAIEGDAIVRHEVTLGARDEGRGLVEIRSGISPGARVLANAPESLREGTKVRQLADSASTATTPGGSGND